MSDNFGICNSSSKLCNLEQLMGCSEELVINICSNPGLQLTLKKSDSIQPTYNNCSQSMFDSACACTPPPFPLWPVREKVTTNDLMCQGTSMLNKIDPCIKIDPCFQKDPCSQRDPCLQEGNACEMYDNTGGCGSSNLQTLLRRKQGDPCNLKNAFSRRKYYDSCMKEAKNKESKDKFNLYACRKNVEQTDSDSNSNCPCGVKDNTKDKHVMIDISRKPKENRESLHSKKCMASHTKPVKSKVSEQKCGSMVKKDGSEPCSLKKDKKDICSAMDGPEPCSLKKDKKDICSTMDNSSKKCIEAKNDLLEIVEEKSCCTMNNNPEKFSLSEGMSDSTVQNDDSKPSFNKTDILPAIDYITQKFIEAKHELLEIVKEKSNGSPSEKSSLSDQEGDSMVQRCAREKKCKSNISNADSSKSSSSEKKGDSMKYPKIKVSKVAKKVSKKNLCQKSITSQSNKSSTETLEEIKKKSNPNEEVWIVQCDKTIDLRDLLGSKVILDGVNRSTLKVEEIIDCDVQEYPKNQTINVANVNGKSQQLEPVGSIKIRKKSTPSINESSQTSDHLIKRQNPGCCMDS